MQRIVQHYDQISLHFPTGALASSFQFDLFGFVVTLCITCEL